MHFSKRAAFSPNSKYFACISTDDKLLVWEISNSLFIDCKFDSNLYSTCSSIHWVLSQHKYASPKKVKISQSYPSENLLLAVGTSKGDVLLYNVTSKNLYLHLVGCHSGAVNDMCFYSETNSFFTCSNDKSIAIWDSTSGKEKSKWKAGDSPVSSICAIDGNNLLSSGTMIIWWNISEKCAIKKFSGCSTEIFKLLPVNAVSLNSCYFLSAAVSDLKINAWSLNSDECQTPVASFVLPSQLKDMDISKISSKDKPLILSAVTKNGYLYLFEHILNGNMNQSIQPKVSIEINTESAESIISTKLSQDSETCIIACGTSKSNMTFKHIKICKILKKNEILNTALNDSRPLDNFHVVKETNKSARSLPVNGIKSSTTSENSSKGTELKDVYSISSNSRQKLKSSANILIEPNILNLHETENFESCHKNRSHLKDVDIKDPKHSVEILLEGLQMQNEDIINAVFHISDIEFISTSVKGLPTNSLKDILTELNHRLQSHQKYSPALSKWLKEILKVHLSYLVQSQDTVETLGYIKQHINSMKISQTISKLSVLKGFLSLQIQNSSSEESDSENEGPMEL